MLNKFFRGIFALKKSSLIKEIVVLLGILIIGLFFSFSHLRDNPFFYFSSDISEYYFPLFSFINQKLHAFSLPVQNEFYLMGSVSFAARGDTSVFYPVLWLFHLLVNVKNNLDALYFIYLAQHIFHYVLGAIFFYFFCRKGLSLNKWASYIAGITYVFSGSFMARLVHPPLQYSLVWYPLLFLFYLLFLRERRLIYVIIDAFIVALLILSGHPQVVYYYFIFFTFSIFPSNQ